MNRFGWPILIATATSLAGLVVGCAGSGSNEAAWFATSSAKLADVTFAVLKSEVLAPNCLRCHGEFANESGVAEHIDLLNPLSSRLVKVVESGEMPRNASKLSSSKIDIVKAYVQNIAQTGKLADAAGESPVEGPVGFAVLKREVLEPKCLKCHAEFDAEAGLAQFVTAGDLAKSELYQQVFQGKMPRKGAKLSDRNIGIVKAYIEGLGARAAPSPTAPTTTPGVAPTHAPTAAPTTAPTEAPVTAEPVLGTWSAVKARLIDVSCVQCHATGNSKDLAVLDTYEGAKALAAGDDGMDDRVNRAPEKGGSMPPHKATEVPRPDDHAKAELKAWIAAGMPH